MTFTNLNFLEPGQPFPFEPDRVAEYEENIAIRENRYDDIWTDYNRKMREDNKDELRSWLGYMWKSTQRTMDFLLGKELCIETEDDMEEELLDDLTDYSDLHQVIYEVMVDCDSLGDGLFKIYKDSEGKSVIQSNCPEIWTQVVEPGNPRRVLYHVLTTEFEFDGQLYLKVEIHTRNAIEHRVYSLNDSTTQSYVIGASSTVSTIGERLPFANFSEQFPDVAELEVHNLGEFLVIPVANTRTSRDVYGRSSYNPTVKALVKKLINRYNQIDRVLDKHSDPNMIGPKGMLELNPITHKPMFRGGGRYFGYQYDPDMAPPKVEYVTWDGNLVPSETAIQRILTDMFNELELPPISMAKDVNGVVSGTAYRLMLSPLIAKVGRLERSMRPNVIKAIKIAMQYQGTPVEDITIQIEDAMPLIPMEEAQRISLLAASGLFAGTEGIKYLLEQSGVPDDVAEKIAVTSLAEGNLSVPGPDMTIEEDNEAMRNRHEEMVEDAAQERNVQEGNISEYT